MGTYLFVLHQRGNSWMKYYKLYVTCLFFQSPTSSLFFSLNSPVFFVIFSFYLNDFLFFLSIFLLFSSISQFCFPVPLCSSFPFVFYIQFYLQIASFPSFTYFFYNSQSYLSRSLLSLFLSFLTDLSFTNVFISFLSLIHIWRCRRSTLCRSRWSPYH